MSKNMNVPQLRFSEFAAEWEEKKLGDILTFKNGINATKEQYGKGYKFINVLDIINNTTIKYENIIGSVDVSKEIFEKNKVVYGNILFQRSSETRIDAGQSNVYLDKNNSATFGGFVIRGQQKIDYNPEFMNYMFKTQLARKEISQKSNGSTHFNVGQETLSKVLVILPSKQEQEKIVSFLTSVDTKIEQLTKKQALLQQYKKSVMQKIFNQELRFKADDGSEFCDLEEKKLGDIGEIVTGKTPSTTDVALWNGDIKFITPTDIDDNVKYQSITQRTVVKQNKMKVLPIGSIVFTCIASIGKMQITLYPSITNQQINSIIVNNNHNNEFIYYSLLNMTPYIKSTQSNTTLPIINKTEFSKFIVYIPSIQEQTKIANFLSSIDNKIEQTTKQLNQTKEFKKALLQTMFV